MAKTLIQAELAQFTGSEQWHQHGINRNVINTDGAKYVADQYEAHWLLDEIALIQLHNSRVARQHDFVAERVLDANFKVPTDRWLEHGGAKV